MVRELGAFFALFAIASTALAALPGTAIERKVRV